MKVIEEAEEFLKGNDILDGHTDTERAKGIVRGLLTEIERLNDALALLKEQEIGHWVALENCSNAGVYCSECRTKVFDHYPIKKKLSYFCPHCGTRMEGEIERR